MAGGHFLLCGNVPTVWTKPQNAATMKEFNDERGAKREQLMMKDGQSETTIKKFFLFIYLRPTSYLRRHKRSLRLLPATSLLLCIKNLGQSLSLFEHLRAKFTTPTSRANGKSIPKESLSILRKNVPEHSKDKSSRG